MTTVQQTEIRPFTLNDIHVGSKLYEALVAHAKSAPGEAIRYGDVLGRCREMHPNDAVVQRAVPIGIGMKLLFVAAFCDRHGYPNLACLAVNQSGSPGEGYRGDWLKDLRDVAQFDWSIAPAKLAVFVAEETARAKPRRRCRVSEDAASHAVWEDYKRDRTRYASFNADDRKEMVNLLMECVELDDAYRTVVQAKSAATYEN